MRILSPADSAAEVAALADAGAEELYAGYNPPFWREAFGPVVTCTRRSYEEASVGTLGELERLIRAAELRDLPVHVALNATPVPPAFLAPMTDLCADLALRGARGVIVSDLGLLLCLRERRFRRLEIHASTLFSAFNGAAAAFLRRAGATRVVLARELTVPEIAAMAEREPKTPLEVIGFRGLCPNVEGFCTHLHDDPNRTWPCELRYEKEWVADPEGAPRAGEAGAAEQTAPDGGRPPVPAEVLEAIGRSEGVDRYYSCGLCAVPLLDRAGVHAFKIVGRGAETARKAEAIEAVKRMRDMGLREAPDAAECARAGKALYREIFGRPCRRENCYFPEFGPGREGLP